MRHTWWGLVIAVCFLTGSFSSAYASINNGYDDPTSYTPQSWPLTVSQQKSLQEIEQQLEQYQATKPVSEVQNTDNGLKPSAPHIEVQGPGVNVDGIVEMTGI